MMLYSRTVQTLFYLFQIQRVYILSGICYFQLHNYALYIIYYDVISKIFSIMSRCYVYYVQNISTRNKRHAPKPVQ